MSSFNCEDFNCEDCQARLQDFVGGAYGPTEERRMREHLASCEDCRREERELRRLLTLVAELPRSVEPPQDLWAGVASRLTPRSAESETAVDTETAPIAPVRLASRPGRDRSRQAWSRQAWSRQAWSRHAWSRQAIALQAAAALIFMVLGAGISRIFLPPSTSTSSHGRLADERPTETGHAGEIRSAAATSPQSIHFAAVESDYLRAKEALWLMVHSRRGELSPVKLEIVQTNLVIVDEAIRELREALADDPGNQLLENRLLAQHRRSVDLLQRLAET